MKAAAQLKVLRVTVIHGRECSTGDPLPQASDAGRNENGFHHVKRTICQPRHSCRATSRVQTCANNEWTWPAKEREIARGVLQIVASLEALCLQNPRGPGVEWCYGDGRKDGERAPPDVMFRDPWASGRSA